MNDSITGGRCSVDAGGRPIALDITARAQRNSLFRAAVWTGRHLQAAVLCVPPGGQAGPEQRPDADQLIGIVAGCGSIRMGAHRDTHDLERYAAPPDVFLVPAGTWHTVVNTGSEPLRAYTVSAPPLSARGAVQLVPPQ